ncbi:MAG: tetratricopeptide repeat protein [Rhodoferax sp.]|nr:tetratricopeptide repeat protein [Rhodoferax sp.]
MHRTSQCQLPDGLPDRLARWLLAALLVLVTACAVRSPQLPWTTDEAGGSWASDESPDRRKARSRLELASAYFENGQMDIALQELHQSLVADPRYSPSWNLSGLMHMQRGDVVLAERSFRTAMDLDPRDAQVQHNMGWLMCQQARYSESFDWFQRVSAVPRYSERAKTHRAWGICAAKAGRPDLAREQLQISQRLDPLNPVTRYHLARALWVTGQVDAARALARILNGTSAASAQTLWLGIQLERQLNDPVAMGELAALLLTRYPHSPEAAALQRNEFDD